MVDRFVSRAHRYRYASDCQVQRDAAGKPALLNGSGNPLPRTCTISHSRDWLACAFGEDQAVGIDIEVAKARNYVETGTWFFGSDVGERLAKAAPALQRQWFYQAWTAYEALYKCGVNMRRNMAPMLWGATPPGKSNITLQWLLGPCDLYACVALLSDPPAGPQIITVLREDGATFTADARWRAAARAS